MRIGFKRGFNRRFIVAACLRCKFEVSRAALWCRRCWVATSEQDGYDFVSEVVYVSIFLNRWYCKISFFFTKNLKLVPSYVILPSGQIVGMVMKDKYTTY